MELIVKLTDRNYLKQIPVRSASWIKAKIWNKDMLFALISAVIFLTVFYFGYEKIPHNFYEYRDDGIITMSHAKNLADYGTISINPSGERVEGYSTPAQFFSYYLYYKLFGISFKVYSQWQTLLATFLLGFVFIKFFKTDYRVGLIFSFMSALLLTKDPGFLGWHGSGMENALTHVLFLTAVYLLHKMYREDNVNYYFVPILFLASVARIESIYYIFPLLLLFAVSRYFKLKDFKGIYLMSAVLGVWVLFNLWRYLYFGDILPNTAYGQQISIFTRIGKILEFSPQYYKTYAVLAGKIMDMHLGYLIGLSLPLLYFVKRQKEILFTIGLLLTVTVASYMNPYLFGAARIEPTRTTTHLAVIAVLTASFIASRLCVKKHTYWILPVFIAVTLTFTAVNLTKPYYLGWEISGFESVRKEFKTLKKQHDIYRPTVCNVDLGVLSWYKQFNVTDLGRLGNPVIARLWKDDKKELLADYIFDLNAPDFIELHDNPARELHFLFTDKRFKERYRPIRETRSPWLKKNAKEFPAVMSGLWIRKDIQKESTSRERLFIDKLQGNLTLDAVRDELNTCTLQADGFTYAARTVYRFIPELVDAGLYDDVVELFEKSNASEFDKAILSGRNDAHWYKRILTYLDKPGS